MARAAAPVCPICGKPPSESARPFCSTRCQKIDLGRWLDERYRIPTVEEDDADSTGGEPER